MKLLLIVVGMILLAAPAAASPVGAPGFSLYHKEQDFSVSGGAGYTHRRVRSDTFDDNQYDTQGSFRTLVRAQYAVLPWLTPMGTVGLADRRRRLTEFSGELGLLAGVGLRVDPIIQRQATGFGVALLLQGSYERSPGRGHTRVPSALGCMRESDERMADAATTWHGEATLLISRKEGRISFYGGPKVDYDLTRYEEREEWVRPQNPFGIVIGVDYDVTPEVFFTAEMENFHKDSIYLLVGGRF